ncbi:UDP-glucose,sterol transferase [Hypoxylon argillaceum]|nr:UDP-glucose,sterol transferase [Hypoxylon argillaceum]
MTTSSTVVYPNPEYSDSDPHAGPAKLAFDGNEEENSKTFLNRLNILIQVVGSRGDVQPFIALGLALQTHGHRVRVATHDVFRPFVTSSGLDFYPVGGDPAELMAYMVSSPRLVPDLATLRAGAIARKRHMYDRMLRGFWEACLADDPDTGAPFVADAIIANPPGFAHVHCAEALGVPCHLVFTMPWSSTGAFPQPLAGMTLDTKGKKVSKSASKTNYVSYAAVNFLTWQGLGDVVNHWRVETLDLEAVPSTEGPHLIETLKVPFTYCWSPSLVSKPPDWGDHIDVCGFFFRNPPAYTPPDDLAEFLGSGPAPIYIGFGSIVVGNAAGLLSMVLGAVRATGVRAVISRGWSSLSADGSDDVFFLGDCPHEWLFQQVTAVVHHGGAGTTACGLRYGRPTAIVPFFGDQPFWGAVVNQAGAGPAPVPYESLTSQKLAQAIRFCLSPAAREAALAVACKIATEDGVARAVDSFHRSLPKGRLQCDFFPDETAVWVHGRGRKAIKMCRGAATVLRQHGVDLQELRLLKTGNITIENRRWDPFTAVSAASLSTVVGVAEAAIDVVRKPIQYRQREHWQEKAVVQTIKADTSVTVAPGGAAMFPLSSKLSSQALRSASKANGAIAASANSMGSVVTRTTRGVLVDIPLAVTEGMRAVPGLWGEKVEEHEPIHDLRSGVSVAGRSFYEGITGAARGVFLRTYEAKKREGATGVLKGLTQGSVGLVTKTGSAITGLVAYPAQGISKSIQARIKGETRRRVVQARWREGEWLLEGGRWTKDVTSVLHDFDGLKGRPR